MLPVLAVLCCLTAIGCAWSTNEIEEDFVRPDRSAESNSHLSCHALTLRNHVDNCPRDQLAKPDRRPMRIETSAHHVWTRRSGLNAFQMRITAIVWIATFRRTCRKAEAVRLKRWRTGARNVNRRLKWYQTRSISECAQKEKWFKVNIGIWRHLVFPWVSERLQASHLHTSTRRGVCSFWLRVS